jgi:hypothetical protein
MIPNMEPGPKPWRLVREGKDRVVVDIFIEKHRYYPPDCVIYESAAHGHEIFAVCGDRTPIAINSGSVIDWSFDADGLRRVASLWLDDGVVYDPHEFIPLDAILDAAGQQPPFDPGWAKDYAFDPFDPPVPVVRTLRPADLGARPHENGHTALHEATLRHWNDVAVGLLRAGADVNAADYSGVTPLHIAATSGNDTLVTRFLGAGATVNARDKTGATPLMYGAQKGDLEVVKQLLAAGADAALRDNDGRTARQNAAGSRNAEMLLILRNAENVASPNLPRRGESP